jgi:hypothetical protein
MWNGLAGPCGHGDWKYPTGKTRSPPSSDAQPTRLESTLGPEASGRGLCGTRPRSRTRRSHFSSSSSVKAASTSAPLVTRSYFGAANRSRQRQAVSQDKDVFRASGGKNNLVNNSVAIDGGEYLVAITPISITLIKESSS